MPVCRNMHDPRPVLLPGNMLELHRCLKAPHRVVIGAENATVIWYEDEGIRLAAFRATRIGR